MEPLKILMMQLREIAWGSIELLPQIAVAVFVLLLTVALNKLIRFLVGHVLARTNLRRSLKELFSLLSSVLVWILGLMIAAIIVFPGLTPASILAASGLAPSRLVLPSRMSLRISLQASSSYFEEKCALVTMSNVKA